MNDFEDIYGTELDLLMTEDDCDFDFFVVEDTDVLFDTLSQYGY